MPDKSKIEKKFSYTWVTIGLSFLMVFTVLGFCSSAKSIYIGPICDALDITRSAYSVNDSCRYITTSIINIFFGSLVAKFGLKKLILAGFGSLIISSILYSIATNVYIFYIGGVFLGIGISWTTTTMVGAVVNRWCKKNKGTIMGFVLASNGLGAALAIQVLSPIINNPANEFGYRDSYRLVAAILIVVAIVILIFFRENPKKQEEGEAPDKGKGEKARGESWSGIEFSDVVKKGYFYGAIVCVFFTGMVLQGITGIAAPHLRDVGLSAEYIALVLSAHSIALSVFKFLTGFIYDRFGLRITTNICFSVAAVVMIIIANVTNSAMGMVLAMIYSIFSSLALPLETIMLPLYASDLFGDKSFNKVLGIFASVNTAGFALGSPIANLCYDILKSYNVAFYSACIIIIVVTVVMQFVISRSNKVKKSFEK